MRRIRTFRAPGRIQSSCHVCLLSRQRHAPSPIRQRCTYDGEATESYASPPDQRPRPPGIRLVQPCTFYDTNHTTAGRRPQTPLVQPCTNGLFPTDTPKECARRRTGVDRPLGQELSATRWRVRLTWHGSRERFPPQGGTDNAASGLNRSLPPYDGWFGPLGTTLARDACHREA